MKKLASISLALLVASALAGSLVADEKTVTLEGKVVCAKCNLKEEGLKDCQNVLVVKMDGKAKHYYLTKSEANKEFGDVCMAEKEVRVTGSVSEKDGKMWLDATEIVPLKKEA
jgi:hypothetical protein